MHWSSSVKTAEGGRGMSCEYCHEDRDGCVVCLDYRGHLWIKHPNKLVLQFDKSRNEFEIRYCPMCGRELKK